MFLIFVCHPSILPIEDILSLLPDSNNAKIISYWNSKTNNFLKNGGIRWSKQRNTIGTCLIIEGGDGFSSQGATDLVGMIEQNFSRDLVIIVSSLHKIPEHVIQRAEVRYSKQHANIVNGWTNYTPNQNDLDGWSRILRS